MLSDPIADMLNRIRNAQKARFEKVDIPASNLLQEIARLLKTEGFVRNYKVISDRKQGTLRIYLKYNEDQKPVITGLKRISRPGRRSFSGYEDLPSIRGGAGVLIISSNKGVVSDKAARAQKLGGELLCAVW